MLLFTFVSCLPSFAQKPGNVYTISTIDTLKIPVGYRSARDAAVITYEDVTGIGGEKAKRFTKEEYTIPKQVEVFCDKDTLTIFIGKNCCDDGYVTIRAFNGLFDYSYLSPGDPSAGFHSASKGKLKLSKKPTCADGETITGEFEGLFFYNAALTDNVIKTIKMNIVFKGTISTFDPPK